MQTDYIPICRVCLKSSFLYIDLQSSFDSNHTQADGDVDSPTAAIVLTYLDCFRECTRLDVEIDDHMTQIICVPCSMDLKTAYEFLKRAESAAQFFEESAMNNIEKLEELEDERSYSSIALKEDVIKFEIKEVSEEGDALAEVEEYPFPSATSDDDNSELEHLTYSGDNDHCDTENSNAQEEKMTSITSNKEIVSNVDDKETTKIHNTNKLNDFCGNNNVNSSESFDLCKICNKNLEDINYSEHMENFHMHVEECQECGYKDKEFKVREHERLKHSKKDDYLCNICSKTFSSLGKLNAHLRFHKLQQSNFKSDACEICGKQFSTQSYLSKHLKVHTNERKIYKCEECGNLYFAKSSLDDHIKMHTGETIKCLECNKEFSRQKDLKIHMRFHTRELPFNCEECGRKFAIKGHLRTHMWKHQGLKVQCDDCGKLFLSAHALTEHSYTHTEMPFPCCYCSKGYPSKFKFKVHLKTAHSIQLSNEEFQNLTESICKKPRNARRKLTLVQTDSVMKEVRVKKKL